VDGRAVKDAGQLIEAIRSRADGQEVSLSIVRDRKAQTVKVKVRGVRS